MLNKLILPIVETFHSLQGEGAHTGRSAFFIRLAGCSVTCSWCDTKYSWSISTKSWRSLDNIVYEAIVAQQEGAAFIVITGGEPLHHSLKDLCHRLARSKLPIHLETSGVDPLTGKFDWITLSPKRHKPPKLEILRACNEVKVIINETTDLLFANSITRLTNDFVSPPLLYLQPGWDNIEGYKLAVDFVRTNPNWHLSLQTHKWLGVR
uniref:7-carboxy-7-deazaguanine synthase n=1 Tax=Paulinella micropora TaxID=1928728 RepID=A0A385I081_9EUKA|nr:7-carboxy-7-deazaguanine synthase [Paulinella micropora]AXY63326.1 7-carboxy-7-deazaguanine synthase [Paulinella micropora]